MNPFILLYIIHIISTVLNQCLPQSRLTNRALNLVTTRIGGQTKLRIGRERDDRSQLFRGKPRPAGVSDSHRR